MKRINLFLLLLLSTLSFAQSWQSKDVVRIENTESSFHYTFYDSTTLYIQKQNVSYIVSLPNSNYIQVGYLYEGATSKIMSCTYNTLTQPVLSSNSELVDTLNAWLNEPSSGGGGGGGNGLDSSGLGGILTQNTTINTNSFNFNISHLADGSLNYSAYIFGCQKGLINYASYNGFEHFVKNEVLKDSCTNYMSSLLGYSNNFTGYGKQISATYNPSTSDNYLQIELNKTTSTNTQDKGTVDFGGGNLFQPTPTIMTIKSEVDYTGDLLLVRSLSQNIFGIDNLGKISADLPSFADDASAGTGGLTTNMLYKTDGTGASPLNVAGIVMIKQ